MQGSHTKKEVVSGIIIHCSKTVHIDLATEIKRYQTFLGESSVCTIQTAKAMWCLGQI